MGSSERVVRLSLFGVGNRRMGRDGEKASLRKCISRRRRRSKNTIIIIRAYIYIYMYVFNVDFFYFFIGVRVWSVS